MLAIIPLVTSALVLTAFNNISPLRPQIITTSWVLTNDISFSSWSCHIIHQECIKGSYYNNLSYIGTLPYTLCLYFHILNSRTASSFSFAARFAPTPGTFSNRIKLAFATSLGVLNPAEYKPRAITRPTPFRVTNPSNSGFTPCFIRSCNARSRVYVFSSRRYSAIRETALYIEAMVI